MQEITMTTKMTRREAESALAASLNYLDSLMQVEENLVTAYYEISKWTAVLEQFDQ